MRVNNSLILDGYSQSSGTVASTPFRIQHFNGYSISVTVSAQSSYGAAAKLQFSNDEGPDQFGGGAAVANWTDAANSGATANLALAANGTSMWNIDGAFYKWVRVFVTWSAGSATLNVRANGKGPDAQ